ncbi:MAG: hypothetical protein ACLR23_23115 [Clostridia bacterium]
MHPAKEITERNSDILRQSEFPSVVPVVLASAIFSIKSMIDSSMFIKLMSWKGYEQEAISNMRGIYQGKFIVLINLPISIGNAMAAASVPSIAHSIAIRDRAEIQSKGQHADQDGAFNLAASRRGTHGHGKNRCCGSSFPTRTRAESYSGLAPSPLSFIALSTSRRGSCRESAS